MAAKKFNYRINVYDENADEVYLFIYRQEGRKKYPFLIALENGVYHLVESNEAIEDPFKYPPSIVMPRFIYILLEATLCKKFDPNKIDLLLKKIDLLKKQ
jgi:hypothetical protein